MSTSAGPGYGKGEISYYIGTPEVIKGEKGCDNLRLIGTFNVNFNGKTRTTELKDTAGNVLHTYSNSLIRKLKSDPGLEVKEEVKEVKRNPTPII